jgi:hypothetical protein
VTENDLDEAWPHGMESVIHDALKWLLQGHSLSLSVQNDSLVHVRQLK